MTIVTRRNIWRRLERRWPAWPGQRNDGLAMAAETLRANALNILFDSMVEGLIVTDRFGTIREINPAACRLFGYGARELVGCNVGALLPPEDLERQQRRVNGVTFDFLGLVKDTRELRGLRKDKSTFYAELSVSAIGARRQGYVALVRDITERRRQEIALRHNTAEVARAYRLLERSESRFRDFAASAADRFWETDAEGRFVYVSPEPKGSGMMPSRLMLGFRPGEMPENTGTNSGLDEFWKAFGAHRRFRDLYVSFERGDGSRFHYKLSGRPVFDEDNEFLGYRGTTVNITAATEAEDRARGVEQRFLAAIDHSPDCIAFYDPDHKFLQGNRGHRELFAERQDLLRPGTPVEEIVREGTKSGRIVIPGLSPEAAAERVIEAHHKLRCGEIVACGDGRWDLVNRYRTADGGTLIMRINITERKRAEEALLSSEADLQDALARLEQSEARFRDFAQSTADRFWETDAEGRITFATEAPPGSNMTPAADLIGHRRGEVPGVGSWDDSLADYEIATAARVDFRDIRTELHRLDGSVNHYRISGRPVFGSNGEFGGFRGAIVDITPVIEAEEQAKSAGRRFVEAIDGIPDGVSLFDAEDRLVHCNPAFTQRLPAIAHMLVPGTPAADIYRAACDAGEYRVPGMTGDRLVEHVLQRHRTAAGGSLVGYGGRQWDLVNRHRTNDGGLITIRTDITERLEAERTAMESERRVRALFDASVDATALIDRDGRILDLNGAMTRNLHMAPADLRGLNLYDQLPQALASTAREGHRRTLAGRREMVRVFETHGRWLEARHLPLFDDAGEVEEISVTVRDITATRRAEELQREAKDEAERASRTKSEFLAHMSHEIRTPLNAIIGFSEAIATGMFGPVGNPRYEEYAADILSSGTHLLEVINDILDLSAIESGKISLSQEHVDIAACYDAVERLVGPKARASGVELTAEFKDGPLCLNADGRRLKQILLNLLTNAVKFTPAGGRVSLTASQLSDGSLIIRVDDTGIGMDAQGIANALTPFGQASPAVREADSGTGLGLPVCVGIMKAHGGSLTLESAPGNGTTALLSFPPERVCGG